ncbi:LAMI_0E00342g1_1 [Lachancea mirantina]|uniref:Mediator of RNA polymerase II transcription subunit 16 n=1 Tax=Lachancea mirantina TaxID=1230905 RepID=A0A1G4JI12_9SACH|nr:LAMI_0E00342g1_1 [Lachancea mirantina]
MFSAGISGQEPVSWSKCGLLAYGDRKDIRSNLVITFLETVNGSNWKFHRSRRYAISPHIFEQNTSNSNGTKTGSAAGKTVNCHYPISSLHWNNVGTLAGDMLAVCDQKGNVTFIVAGHGAEGSGTLDRLSVVFQDTVYKMSSQMMPLVEARFGPKLGSKPSKNTGSSLVIHFEWLSGQKPAICMHGAIKDQATGFFKSQVQQCEPWGLFHPASIKSASFAIRRNAQLDFWYQFSNSKEHKKISLQLNNLRQQQTKQLECLRFAKCAHSYEGNSSLVGTYSALENRFSLYKLDINWNSTTTDTTNEPSVALHQIFCFNPDLLGLNGELLELSNFEMISASYDKKSRAELLLCYTIQESSRSLIKRYEVTSFSPATELTAIFGTVTSQTASSGPTNFSLSDMGSLELDGEVVGIETRNFDTVVIFRLKNGYFKIFNRFLWSEEGVTIGDAPKLNDSKKITSITCSGMKYPKVPALEVIDWVHLSPAMGGYAFKMKYQSEASFKAISIPDLSDETENIMHAVSFAHAFVVSNHQQLSGEDLSIAIKEVALKWGQEDNKKGRQFMVEVIRQVMHLFGLTPDTPKELKDKIMMSRPIQRAILLQLELGGSFDNKNMYSLPRAIMLLRNIMFAFNGVSRNIQVIVHHITTMTIQQPASKLFQFAFSKQDLIYSLIPCAKWFVKFITFLTQQLIVLVNNSQMKEETLVLSVLASKISRTLLLSILSEIKKIVQLITKFPETNYPILNESSVYLRKVLGDSQVNFEKFETFLVDVNNKFTSLGEQQNQLSPTNADTYLIFDGDFSEDMKSIKDFLLTYSNMAILSHIKPADVYFADTSALRIFASEYFSPEVFRLLQPIEKGLVIKSNDLPENASSERSFSPLTFDSISHEPINPAKTPKIKRCCRCSAITRTGYPISKENTVIPTSISAKRWSNLYSRVCMCSGFLYELDDD